MKVSPFCLLAFAFAILCQTMSITSVQAQKTNPVDYLSQLPKDLIPDNTVIHKYRMTTDYMDYDLKGDFIRKSTIAGDYTCGLKGDSVRWNNVYVSQVNDLGKPFSIKKDFLENFTYLPTSQIMNKDFFKEMPEDQGMLMKNLIWDTFMLQGIAYWYWDSLVLNQDFKATALNTEVDLAGAGTFENKDTKLKWLGVTKINNEIYAIIKYSTLNNKVQVDMENLTMSGRSHYWGEIYVSLKDKHVEYATLTEDVITDLLVQGQPRYLGYSVRSITLSRTQ